MSEEAINDDHLNDHYIYSVYKMLIYMGINPSDLVPNMTSEDADQNGRTASMILGIRNTQVGISIEQDNPGPYLEDGWFVSPASLVSLKQMHEAFQALESFAIEHRRRSTMNATKQTSRHEQWLIDAIIQRRLPVPERNHKLLKDDGKELTTPDMAWPDLKIAFFVDGLWWHQSREDTEIVKGFLEDESNQEYLLEHNRTRAEKDLAIRSEMSTRGWRVLSCTDRDLENQVGIQNQVRNIERMMDLVRKEQAALAQIVANRVREEPADVNTDSAFSVDDFLN